MTPATCRAAKRMSAMPRGWPIWAPTGYCEDRWSPEPVRRLRDLTRARTALTRDRARQVQRIEKVLEDAGIKLSTVATDIMGVSGRAMLDALIDGRDEPAALADPAKGRVRSTIAALAEARTGGFPPRHGFLIRMHLNLIDEYAKALDELDARIEEA